VSFKRLIANHEIALEYIIQTLFDKYRCIVSKTGKEYMGFSKEMVRVINSDPLNMRFLRIRGFPDIEIFPENEAIDSFYLDVKTICNDRRIAYPEAFPWADSVERYKTKGKRTLYVYALPAGFKCFWTDNTAVIFMIHDWKYRVSKLLPREAEQKINEYLYSGVMRKTFEKPPFGISGDCSAMIYEHNLLRCHDFDDEMKFLLA
jgi:hypothetical protein